MHVECVELRGVVSAVFHLHKQLKQDQNVVFILCGESASKSGMRRVFPATSLDTV